MENDADQAGEPARDEGEIVAIFSREDADEEDDGIASIAAAAAIVDVDGRCCDRLRFAMGDVGR